MIILEKKISSAQRILVLTRVTLFKAGESLIQLSINLVHSLSLLFDMQIPWIIVRYNIILKKDREVSLKLLVLFNYSVIAKWKNDFIFLICHASFLSVPAIFARMLPKRLQQTKRNSK